MSEKVSESSANYVLLTRLADEFAARYRAGERPALQEYIDRYPDLADDIRDLFPAMAEIEVAEEHRGEPSGGVASGVAAPPLQQVGGYRVIREVGRGGMGVVYEAEQLALGRRVALKVLPPGAARDGQALPRFQREARAAAKLHHTNIVPVFEVVRDGDVSYYAMQFIHGQGLDQVIAELRRLWPAAPGKRSASGPQPALSRAANSLVAGHFEPAEPPGNRTGEFV